MRISDWSSDVCSSDLDRHDIGMTGKGEVAAARPTPREQILDRPVGSLAERHPPDLKADALQRRLQDVHRTLVGGGDAGAADKRLGKGNGQFDRASCREIVCQYG